MALVEHPGDSGHWQRRSVQTAHVLSGARASLGVGGLSKLSPLRKYQLSLKLWVCYLQAELRRAFWYKCCLGGRPWAGGGLGVREEGRLRKDVLSAEVPLSLTPLVL